MYDKKIGVALCGSFCNFERVYNEMVKLKQGGADLRFIMSENAAETDTRFGSAGHWKKTFSELSQEEIITSISSAEPIGPKKMFDILLVCPCTGNTLAKLSHGITDTPVTMAVKSHLRGGRPVVLAIATNDGLAASAQNIGKLLNTKNYFFVPFTQDDPYQKPTSLICDFAKISDTIEVALTGRQIRPVLL